MLNKKEKKSIKDMFKYIKSNNLFIGITIAAIGMPIMTTIFTVIPNNLPNFTIENDWIGFFGSYTGAIIGGLITLAVMETTIKSGNKNVEDTIKATKQIEDRNNRINFANEIVNIVARYCSEYKTFRHHAYYAEENRKEKNELKAKYYSEKNSLEENRKDPLFRKQEREGLKISEIDRVNEYFNLYNEAKGDFKNELHRLESIDIYSLYFLLNIKLLNIPEASELNKKIDKVKNLSQNFKEKDKDEADKEFYESINEILLETNRFFKKYTQI